MRKIIALTGPQGCGKSAAASFFIEKYNFKRHYFAKPLKDMMKCLGLTEEHVNGSLKELPCDELLGQTPRWAMRSIGTEWGRKLIHQDIWTHAWKNTMPKGNIICDDLRFPNELKVIREMKGAVIEIERPGVSRTNAHESESHSLPYDMKIVNDGTIEDLHKKLEKIYSHFA